MLAALHPVTGRNDHAYRVTHYRQFENEIDDTGITWPIPLTQIPRFERQNKYDELFFIFPVLSIVHYLSSY